MLCLWNRHLGWKCINCIKKKKRWWCLLTRLVNIMKQNIAASFSAACGLNPVISVQQLNPSFLLFSSLFCGRGLFKVFWGITLLWSFLSLLSSSHCYFFCLRWALQLHSSDLKCGQCLSPLLVASLDFLLPHTPSPSLIQSWQRGQVDPHQSSLNALSV